VSLDSATAIAILSVRLSAQVVGAVGNVTANFGGLFTTFLSLVRCQYQPNRQTDRQTDKLQRLCPFTHGASITSKLSVLTYSPHEYQYRVGLLLWLVTNNCQIRQEDYIFVNACLSACQQN